MVGSALGEFLQRWSHDLLYVAKRTSKSLNGVAEATGHYVEGDLTLAANAQREAAKEPKVDLPGQGQRWRTDQDRFLHDYVELLNESDETGLARLLDAHPQGDKDARARVKAYGGQDWDVRWSRTSEFEAVWSVDLTGTARAEGRPVRLTETITWEDEHWVMAPLPGVVPKPSNAADTEPPG